MIKAPSLQQDYTLIYSGDPSLVLPPPAFKPDGTEDPDSERERLLAVARETGQWDALIVTGEAPTKFHVRPITGVLLDWLNGEQQRRRLTVPELAVLALRLALRRIDGFGDHKVELERDGVMLLASYKTVDALYAIDGEVEPGRSVGRDIVQELGQIILERSFGKLRPKS